MVLPNTSSYLQQEFCVADMHSLVSRYSRQIEFNDLFFCHQPSNILIIMPKHLCVITGINVPDTSSILRYMNINDSITSGSTCTQTKQFATHQPALLLSFPWWSVVNFCGGTQLHIEQNPRYGRNKICCFDYLHFEFISRFSLTISMARCFNSKQWGFSVFLSTSLSLSFSPSAGFISRIAHMCAIQPSDLN